MVFILAVSGYIINTCGWEGIFYSTGLLGCFWFIGWALLIHEQPTGHPAISPAEKAKFLEVSDDDTSKGGVEQFPWRRALTSMPFVAICVAHFGSNWGFFSLLTNLPTYLHNIMHFDLESNGLISALPYFGLALSTQFFSLIADWLKNRNFLSITGVRRLSQCVALLTPAGCLLGLGFTTNSYVAVTLLVLAVAATGAGGLFANMIDLAPRYAGLLMGISQTCASIPGIMAPYLIGMITAESHGQSTECWKVVFSITAGVSVGSALFYAIFVSGELQQWSSLPAPAAKKLDVVKTYESLFHVLNESWKCSQGKHLR